MNGCISARVLPALRRRVNCLQTCYSPLLSRSLSVQVPNDAASVPPLGNPLDYVDKSEDIEELARLLEQKLEDVFSQLVSRIYCATTYGSLLQPDRG